VKTSEAEELVRRMFSAQGRNPTESIVTELGLEVAQSSCAACARSVISDNRDNARGPLTVPTFRAGMAAIRSSTVHMDHVGHSDTETLSSDLETFWRDAAATAIAARLEIDRETAQLLAAELWVSQHDYTWHHNPQEAAELCVDSFAGKDSAATWVVAAIDRYTAEGGPSRDMVEAAFDRARRAFLAGGIDALWEAS
jgi:hypothetical protein